MRAQITKKIQRIGKLAIGLAFSVSNFSVLAVNVNPINCDLTKAQGQLVGNGALNGPNTSGTTASAFDNSSSSSTANCGPGGTNTAPVIQLKDSSSVISKDVGSSFSGADLQSLVSITASDCNPLNTSVDTGCDLENGNISPNLRVEIKNQAGTIVLSERNLSDASVSSFSFDTSAEENYEIIYRLSDSEGLTATPKTRHLEILIAGDVNVNAGQNRNVNAANVSNFALAGSCSNNGQAVVISNNGTQITSTNCSSGVWSTNADLSSVSVSNFNTILRFEHNGFQRDLGFTYDLQAPTITLTQTSAEILQGAEFEPVASSYIASATDDRDGNLISAVSLVGSVNTDNVGSCFLVHYSVSDAVGNIGTSNDLNVCVVAPTNTYTLLMDSPADGEVGTSDQPSFQWRLFGPDASQGVTFNFSVFLNADCSGASIGNAINTSNSYIDQLDGIRLIANTTYCWKITATKDDIEIISNQRQSFTVRQDAIPRLALTILPSTTASARSGQQQIQINGSNGESRQVAVIYEVQDRSSSKEIKRVNIETSGSFTTNLDISQTRETAEFKYFAILERDGLLGPNSEQVSYFYDPALTITAPSLQYDTSVSNLGKMKWATVSGANKYAVWRRINLDQLCDSSTETCYMDSTPYKKIASLSSDAATGGFIHFVDTEIASASITPDANGVSYFVTAIDDGGDADATNDQSSLRSNSLSFLDTTAVSPFTAGRPRMLYLQDSYTAQVYACDVFSDYAWDNSADLRAEIQFAPRGNSECTDFTFDTNSTSQVNIFDSLKRVDINNSQDLIQGCVPVAFINNLAADTQYCVETCFTDISNTGELSRRCDINNVDTPVDGEAPEFDGITELVARSDGTSLLAKWDPAIQLGTQEVLAYKIQVADSLNQNGEPNYFPESIIVNGVQNDSAIIPNLETGKKYYVQVLAFDNFGNENPGTQTQTHLAQTTLDNRPVILNAELKPTEEFGVVELCLHVSDRNENDTVSLSSLQLGQAGSAGNSGMNSVTLENSIASSAVQSFTALSTNGVSPTCGKLNLLDTLSLGDYQNTAFLVVVQDTTGLQGSFRGQSSLESDLALGTSKLSVGGSRLAAGCNIQANSTTTNTIIGFVVFALLALMRIFFCRKSQTKS